MVSCFTTVHRPCITWRLWVSEPHGSFVCAFVLHLSDTSLQPVQCCICIKYERHPGRDMLLPWEPQRSLSCPHVLELEHTVLTVISMSFDGYLLLSSPWNSVCFQFSCIVIWQKKYNSGFTSIQLWPLWTCNAFCMFKLIMHFYFMLWKKLRNGKLTFTALAPACFNVLHNCIKQ